MLIADLHVWPDTTAMKKILKDEEYDLIISLGDNSQFDLQNIIASNVRNVPIYGVLGNHDTYSTFTEFPSIVNLHYNKVSCKELSLIGIEGCMRYKESSVPMYDDDQVCRLVKTMPSADILVSHTGPAGLMDSLNDELSRKGFEGFNNYYLQAKPKYHFFGHYHRNEHHTKYHGWNSTECYCVFGISIFDTVTNTMTNYYNENE